MTAIEFIKKYFICDDCCLKNFQVAYKNQTNTIKNGALFVDDMFFVEGNCVFELDIRGYPNKPVATQAEYIYNLNKMQFYTDYGRAFDMYISKPKFNGVDDKLRNSISVMVKVAGYKEI